MELNGLLELNKAHIDRAKAQADIANTMADIPQKLAQANLTQQQAIHQHLENVAKFYDIKWNVEAHTQLIRMRNIALQNSRRAENKSREFEEKLHFLQKLMMPGTSTEGIRQGWIAFNYVSSRIPGDKLLGALGSLKWSHTVFEEWNKSDGYKFSAAPGIRPSTVFTWALKNNLQPVIGTPAWEFMSDYIVKVDTAAVVTAAEMNAESDKARQAAMEIVKRDWDRLNQPASEPAG